MSKKLLFTAALLSLVCGVPLANAIPLVDQQHDLSQSVGGSITFTDFEVGQTFTVGQSGLLSQVDLTLGTAGSPAGPVQFEIRDVLNGLPVDGAPLYSGTIPVADIPVRGSLGNFPFVPVDLAAANLPVTAGDELALVVARDAPHGFENTVIWERGLPGYAGGNSMSRFGTQAWSTNSTYDYGFRTWVDSNPNTNTTPGPAYSLFETTQPLPPDNNVFNGQLANSQSYTGVNFQIQRTTKINSVGAHFVSGSGGQVFGAIVKLDDRNGAPNPTDLSGADVLGHTLIDLPTEFSTTADASGDLDLTLEPGFYGLWFGSGQFGATGNGFLSTENDPIGAWNIWTLQQPSGNRNFLSSDVRVFIEAASAPGTVQVRPTVDVAAEGLILEDGEARIELDETPFNSSPKRGILEFDISHIPANAIIEGALLEVDTNGRSSNGIDLPQMSLFGYEGNGIAEPDDVLEMDTLVGTSDPLEELGMLSVQIDAAYVQSQLGSNYLGLLATSTNSNSSIDFYPTENRGFGEAPLLTIFLSVPGDFDGDLDVDGEDLLAWQRGDSPNPMSADDLSLWQQNYAGGAGTLESAVAVPEPASMMLCGLVALALIQCRADQRRAYSTDLR